MMGRPECRDDEDVVRAITAAHWDPEEVSKGLSRRIVDALVLHPHS
ncbi:hypothetical protein [Longimicrobium sp.]|nr:hypothetical protein [Longimicrobium sp.]